MPSELLYIPNTIRREVRIGWLPLLKNKAHEFKIKASGNRIKGQGMIGAAPNVVEQGFGSLQGDDFHEYNLPQAWVEARMIPQVLHGRVPRTHATIIDLGCGPATSTQTIAHFADPSWTILGYDLTPHLIAAAEQRTKRGEIRNRTGQHISPIFVCQDISHSLQHPSTKFLESKSVDLALSGGVVGLYMNHESARRLAVELRRVLKPNAYAALDAGSAIPIAQLKKLMTDEGFTYRETIKSFFIEPRPKLVFQSLS